MFILCLLAYLPFMIIFTSDIGKKVIATQKLNTCCCKEQLTAFFYRTCGNEVYALICAMHTLR